MQKFIYLVFFLFTKGLLANSEEAALQKSCSASDLIACENLTAFYVKESKWDNALAIGEVLCKKDSVKGCTFAGTAALAKGMNREGVAFLRQACDGFEPYACRSLSRLMKKNKEDKLSYIYQKRACYYGHSESCGKLNKPKDLYSKKGEEFLKDLIKDCETTTAESCKSKLANLEMCFSPLEKMDCMLMAGDLSIIFRAKLIQENAKLALLNIMAQEKLIKETAKFARYTYDLDMLLNNQKAQNTYHYVFGFQRACTTKFEKRKTAMSTSLVLYKNSYKALSNRTKKNIAAFFYKEKAADCYEPTIGFEAFAAANLDPLNPARLDVWKINRDGNILQLQDGLPK